MKSWISTGIDYTKYLNEKESEEPPAKKQKVANDAVEISSDEEEE